MNTYLTTDLVTVSVSGLRGASKTAITSWGESINGNHAAHIRTLDVKRELARLLAVDFDLTGPASKLAAAVAASINSIRDNSVEIQKDVTELTERLEELDGSTEGGKPTKKLQAEIDQVSADLNHGKLELSHARKILGTERKYFSHAPKRGYTLTFKNTPYTLQTPEGKKTGLYSFQVVSTVNETKRKTTETGKGAGPVDVTRDMMDESGDATAVEKGLAGMLATIRALPHGEQNSLVVDLFEGMSDSEQAVTMAALLNSLSLEELRDTQTAAGEMIAKKSKPAKKVVNA